MQVLPSAAVALPGMQQPGMKPTANGPSVPPSTPTLTRVDRPAHGAEHSSSAPPTEPSSYETNSAIRSNGGAQPHPRPASSDSSQNTTRTNEIFHSPSSTSSNQNVLNDYGLSSQTSFGSEHTIRPPRPITPSTDADVDDRYTSGTNSALTSPVSVASSSHIHGSKRTANGTVKLGSPGRINEADYAGWHRHSRDMSRDSTEGRIGELSAQLKARLSYAAFKVQNGLQARNIEELEKLNFPHTSPVSIPNASPRQPLNGLSAPITDMDRQASGLLSGSGRGTVSLQYQPSPVRTQTGLPPSQDEPFWAPQSRQSTAQSTGGTAPALAPAPDIISKSRRPNSTHLPPKLSTSRANAGYHTQAYTQAPPKTPTKTPRSTPSSAGILRTPSQRADQDAVDTLLLLASPSNFTKFSRSTASTATSPVHPSPLRRDWSTPGKRVAFERSICRQESNSSSGGDSWRVRGLTQPTQGRVFARAPARNEQDVDKMLDDMDGEASSSDEEDLMQSRHRRLAVGAKIA